MRCSADRGQAPWRVAVPSLAAPRRIAAGAPTPVECRCYESPTRTANAPHFIKGVVNLRGVIVPIVDQRLTPACESAAYTDFKVVIVLNVEKRAIGVVVDSVSGVLALDTDSIKPAMNTSSRRA
ncbi:CheW-like protein [Roseateles toxinivorans]|uniref:Chemotaxis protein CheW n=1 Tax=Roseateles toxinivorans TaxID=270368 RepID=A0A4R6QNH2_9BURK|nr:CheW-like protein [Roseateles toxinivorans]